jgi:hypothetical protein
MVTEYRVGSKTVFLCEECGFGYADRETAKKCEDWCRKTRSCSLEITEKAVYHPNASS